MHSPCLKATCVASRAGDSATAKNQPKPSGACGDLCGSVKRQRPGCVCKCMKARAGAAACDRGARQRLAILGARKRSQVQPLGPLRRKLCWRTRHCSYELSIAIAASRSSSRRFELFRTRGGLGLPLSSLLDFGFRILACACEAFADIAGRRIARQYLP